MERNIRPNLPIRVPRHDAHVRRDVVQACLSPVQNQRKSFSGDNSQPGDTVYHL
jgi:hypothetical protein